MQKTTRQYKDTFFRTLFGINETFLELYNAVSGNHILANTNITLYPPNPILARFNDLAAYIGYQTHLSSTTANRRLN